MGLLVIDSKLILAVKVREPRVRRGEDGQLVRISGGGGEHELEEKKEKSIRKSRGKKKKKFTMSSKEDGGLE